MHPEQIRAIRAAAETLDFWVSKVAYLEHALTSR
jgi:hypothetical protein